MFYALLKTNEHLLIVTTCAKYSLIKEIYDANLFKIYEPLEKTTLNHLKLTLRLFKLSWN